MPPPKPIAGRTTPIARVPALTTCPLGQAVPAIVANMWQNTKEHAM
jgi:hypothetical protein